MVVIPALENVDYCPVKAIQRYIKYRSKRVRTKVDLPLFMTENIWKTGRSKPSPESPGFYTQNRFRKDVNIAVAELIKFYPTFSSVAQWLVIHSLRSGKNNSFYQLLNIFTFSFSLKESQLKFNAFKPFLPR